MPGNATTWKVQNINSKSEIGKKTKTVIPFFTCPFPSFSINLWHDKMNSKWWSTRFPLQRDLTFCWDCKWVPRFLLEDLQAGNFMKNMPWSWFIVLPHQLIHSFRSKWSNNPRSYPTIFRSKFLDPTHEIFRIKTGWLWQQEYLANIYFLWLQAGRRTVRRWKRNPSRLVLRFSRNSTRPAGLRTCRGVLLSQWVEPCRYGEKTLGDDLRYSRLGLLAVFFWKFLAILKDGPPNFWRT